MDTRKRPHEVDEAYAIIAQAFNPQALAQIAEQAHINVQPPPPPPPPSHDVAEPLISYKPPEGHNIYQQWPPVDPSNTGGSGPPPSLIKHNVDQELRRIGIPVAIATFPFSMQHPDGHVYLNSCVLVLRQDRLQQNDKEKRGTETLFIGNLPTGITEDIIAEIFMNFGPIFRIFLSDRRFAFLRFRVDGLVEQVIDALSGWSVALRERPNDPPARINLDFADNRPLWEADLKDERGVWQPELNLQASELGLLQFNNSNGRDVADKMKDEATFCLAAETLMRWLEAGEVKKHTAPHFFSIFEKMHQVMQRQIQRQQDVLKVLVETQSLAANTLASLTPVYESAQKALQAACLQKVRDQLSKPQRRALDTWLLEVQLAQSVLHSQLGEPAQTAAAVPTVVDMDEELMPDTTTQVPTNGGLARPAPANVSVSPTMTPKTEPTTAGESSPNESPPKETEPETAAEEAPSTVCSKCASAPEEKERDTRSFEDSQLTMLGLCCSIMPLHPHGIASSYLHKLLAERLPQIPFLRDQLEYMLTSLPHMFERTDLPNAVLMFRYKLLSL